MLVGWRICRRPHADLAGAGARLVGGRWNNPGRPMLYMAATPELAALEVRVHLDLPPELIPDDYVLMSVDLDGLTIEEVPDLPADPAEFGDRWLAGRRTPILRVPSFIVPESSNLLVNPLHPDGGGRMRTVRDFSFDRRLWLPLR
ncbi:RES family NAD+ phosphorylase [Rhodoblastus acidophilus]|uniref:RES family NAD+ phosphorylase n=1 Tax=Candidatus Rhodoblastus alkanivorans TaxID=2954117 RepID=A0ABS9Z9P5_9HYPH|nr:RES family NAD+ phosphorylase [Candidatus Rhodoblastus alkanivorans]MCI4679842.1 RES family NAD+ phosphorylase [Candidatus Rhodoblastus alkanivorans]MCI4684348.1 RES family NAD+ phosphorylase [Candidatus Rhodoblastus alkanivorans]MDI4641669.1 RES family NAD+ phosphorylase [Rhodoblastus acidophilus]